MDAFPLRHELGFRGEAHLHETGRKRKPAELVGRPVLGGERRGVVCYMQSAHCRRKLGDIDERGLLICL